MGTTRSWAQCRRTVTATKAKRKLVRFDVLNTIATRIESGVSVAKVMREAVVDMSRPVLLKLVEARHLSQLNPAGADALLIRASLQPDWLEACGDTVQESPEGWAYAGQFPYGTWVRLDD